MFVPYTKAIAVTPSDSVNLRVPGVNIPENRPADGLFVGTAGVVAVVLQDDTVVNFKAAAGTFLWISVKRVNSKNTTASDIVALYRV